MYLSKTSGNLNPRGQQPQSNLQISTIRSFEGGLNVADTDLNMAPKYAKTLDNIERAPDGSLSVRPGTPLMCNSLTSSADIVNHTYFVNHIITVQTDGSFALVLSDGTSSPMLLSGAKPWPGPVDFVSFTVFNSDLIVSNGRDKPIIVSGDPLDGNFLQAQFLIDLGTLSNVNTPVGKYVIAHGQYTCIAGIGPAPSMLYISARSTSGTYFGDPAPNDAVAVDLGPRVSLGSATITGLVAYRDKLLVTFERGVLALNLGVYTGSPQVHTPSDDGFIEEFGCLAHRSLISVGDDTFFCDNVGINSISRVNVFNTLRPVRASHLIDPLTTAAIQPLTIAQINKYVFAVYDLRNFRYMLFVPTFDAQGNLVETVGFSYTSIPTLKIQAWARLRGWKWQSACRTALQNVIFSMGNKLYSYDFDGVKENSDFIGDPAINGGKGIQVSFVWEMPWADFKHRMDIKQTRYIALDTQGTASFTVEGFVDNIIMHHGVSSPMLRMQFTAGDSTGYGDEPYGDAPYGGGRRSSDERLFAWTTKFKLLKLRFSGTTRSKLKFISVSVAYVHGGIRR
jgi:hypothetical protein